MDKQIKHCAIMNCENEYYARGWCFKHYGRWLRNGDPLKTKMRELGTGGYDKKGYLIVMKNGRSRPIHVIVAEKALGKPLPLGAVVHHADEAKGNNNHSNLVICQDENYHRLLHVRLRAVKSGTPADYRKCHYCKEYDDPKNLSLSSGRYSHVICRRSYERNRDRSNRRVRIGNAYMVAE